MIFPFSLKKNIQILPFQVTGFSQGLYEAILMLCGVSIGNYHPEVVDQTITSEASDHFELGVKFTAYATLVLAFIILTIALTNILVGLSVNIAAEGINQAEYQRHIAMVRNLYGIAQLQ